MWGFGIYVMRLVDYIQGRRSEDHRKMERDVAYVVEILGMKKS